MNYLSYLVVQATAVLIMAAERIFDAEGESRSVEDLQFVKARLVKLAESLALSASELNELEKTRASNRGAIRDTYEVLLNTLLQTLIADFDDQSILTLFGTTEPLFTDFVSLLEDSPEDIKFLLYRLAEELDLIIRKWREFVSPDNHSAHGAIAKQVYERTKYYLLKQLSTKLGEGVHLDDGREVKAYFEELYDSDKKMVADLARFVRKYGLKQRIAKHDLQLKGPVSIEHLRGHFQKVRHLPYLTREPIEDRNLHLLELLSRAKGTCVFEVSPPFYANEDDFIIRCSWFDGEKWIINSYFLSMGSEGRAQVQKAYELFRKLFADHTALESIVGDVRAQKIMHTSRNHDHTDHEKRELLDLFANVFVVQSGEDGDEVQKAILDEVLGKLYNLSQPVALLEANDRYVVGKIERELMPTVEKFVETSLAEFFDDEPARMQIKLADVFGVVVHAAVATLTPLKNLIKKGYAKDDIALIRNGGFLTAAAKGGRSQVNQLAGTLSTGRLETDYSSSCESSEDTFAPATDTRGWLSTEKIQHIDGIGDFAKVTLVNPRNAEEQVVFYRCNHCGEASIDACAVKKGCRNSACRASYDQIVFKARSGVMPEQTVEKSYHQAESAPKAGLNANRSTASVNTGDSFFRGALNLLTFGLAERVDEG